MEEPVPIYVFVTKETGILLTSKDNKLTVRYEITFSV